MRKQTDPRSNATPDNAMDAHTGHREIDPVTGHDINDHDWNGIRELNTPFPKIVTWALIVTFIYSLIAWILLPAWPIGRDYTRGVLGLDQGEMAIEKFQAIGAGRSDWMAKFASDDFAMLQNDDQLMVQAMPAADRLFKDNCAACHANDGGGGPGFPALNDGDWLWGGDPADIAETLHIGINAANDDTRWAEMPPFDWMALSERMALADYVVALGRGTADGNAPEAQVFVDNCSACHGETGEGGMMIGAPSLTDASVIYGQDHDTVMQTLRHGRQGVMPAWSNRLSDAEINLLAVYVAQMSSPEAEVNE